MSSHGAVTKKPRKERAQLSCTFCRYRKLKCDRQSPCGNCVKREQAPTCYFTHPHGGRAGKASTADVQNRVKHLESLVLGLMSGNSINALQTPSDSLAGPSQPGSVSSEHGPSMAADVDGQDQTIQALGKLDVSGANIQYMGTEHWASILDDIAEVKQHLEYDIDSPDEMDSPEAELDDAGPDLLLGAGRMPLKEEMLELLPPKAEVDRLVSSYFASSDPFCMLLHRPSFQVDYERFWNNPAGAPLAWIGLIFAIMSLSTFSQLAPDNLRAEEAAELAELVNSYRRSAAQCLIMSNYTKPVRWTLEALMVYTMSEFIRSRDTQMGLWVILGITLRLAMRMGYHRDSTLFPQISAFHGEIRRRIWALLTQLDLLSSVQFGLPRLVHIEQTDTELPGNYLDTDLEENMATLPPPRPDSQYTPMSYSIVKGRLTRAFGSIADSVVATKLMSYEHTLRLDSELTNVYNAMPEMLRVKPAESSVIDEPGVVFRRFTLDILYHKSRCILHRNYIVPARTNERYTFSLQCAMSSAKAILQHQVSMYEETQPGGRLRKDRWLMSGLTTEDFTLAAMVICLSVDSLMNSKVATEDTLFAGHKREFVGLIESSYNIWNEWKKQPELASPKSEKASEVLGIMLRKIHYLYSDSAHSDETALVQPPSVPMIKVPPPPQPTTFPSEASAPMSDAPAHQTLPDSAAAAYFPELAPITDWIEAPQDINWDEWDDLFQPSVEAMELPNAVWDESSSVELLSGV